ncbi:MAG: T9SS type A sorting domain-containing protein [Ignavibacteriae bacterium]|nr:T9SS C-terminal target domain-containing protein [Ignavibacteriota bacterium]NOG99551.1 T9SS type A sorting domain-containing protein [Ignavibacteriota bacterium]
MRKVFFLLLSITFIAGTAIAQNGSPNNDPILQKAKELLSQQQGFTVDSIFVEQKIEEVKSKILAEYADKIDEVAIFISQELYRKKSSVNLKDNQSINFDLPFENAIVCLIDLMPTANLGHPFKYIFIEPLSGNRYDYVTKMPLVNTELLKLERINDLTIEEKIIKDNNQEVQKTIDKLLNYDDPEQIDPNKFAVLISGGARRAANFERYYDNIKLMYLTLVKNYSYPEDHIFVFFAGGAIPDGGSYDDTQDTHQDGEEFVEINTARNSASLNEELRSSDLDGDGDCDISNSAFQLHIESLFENELKTLLNNNSNSKSLLIYTFDHGNQENNNEVILNLWNFTEFDDDDFVTMINVAPYVTLQNLNISMQQCHSGGFLDELQSSNITNWSFTSAADYYEVSYGGGSQGVFAYNWPLYSSGEDFNDVDANDDDQLSLEEIYNHARTEDRFWPANDPIGTPPQENNTEHPQFETNPTNNGDNIFLGNFSPYQSEISGTISYYNNLLSQNDFLFNTEIRLYKDVIGIDIEVGNKASMTNEQGEYNIFTNTTDDVFIKIKLENENIRVADDDPIFKDVFKFPSSQISIQPGFNELNFNIEGTNPNFPACNLFSELSKSNSWYWDNLSWQRIGTEGQLPTPIEDQLDIIWIGSNTEATSEGFNASDDYIGVTNANLWNSTYLNYNYSLANIYNVYVYSWPAGFQSDQGLNVLSNESTALINGLAWFLTAAIADDPDAVQFGGGNIETNTWWQGESGTNTNGQIVEGAIASFFWDLYDNVNEAGDNINGKLFEIWNIFVEYQPQNIDEFMAYWSYEDLFSTAQLNHLLLQKNVQILTPSDGEPLIVDFTNLNSLIVAFEVFDESGTFVPGLAQNDITVEIGGESCTNISLQDDGSKYNIEFTPVSKAEIGLYDLQITVTFTPTEAVSSDIVLNGALYTNQVVIEKGLKWLKAQQNVTAEKKMYSIPLGGTSNDNRSGTKNIELLAQGSWKYGSSPNAGITALALQAFLANGYGIDHPVYGATIENAINYLLNNQVASGYHLGAIYNSQQGYETAMAIVALKSAIKIGLPDPLKTNVENSLVNALNYYTQDVDIGWSSVSWRYNRGYTSQSGGDMSVNQWVYLALSEMDYSEKDIWNKIYTYINNNKGSSGDEAWIGYTGSSSRTGGNSLAGIWGLTLAGQNGVSGAAELSQQMFNFIDSYNGVTDVNGLLSPPSLTSYYVVSSAGYYYYVYELAKALALSGKTQFLNENWYSVLFNRIDGQHNLDNNNYYWRTGWTDPSGYSIASGGMGNHGNTALALLSLQVGTVPPDSRFIIRLGSPAIAGIESLPADVLLNVYDGNGNFAGKNASGVWVSNIPNSQWNSTSGTYELEINLTTASSFTAEIANNSSVSNDYVLELEAYQGTNQQPVSSENFPGTVEPDQSVGTTATVNAIGGLNVYAPPPEVLPHMVLNPTAYEIRPIENDSTYSLDFWIKETGGSSELSNVDIFASDLVDPLTNTIDASNFTIVPSHVNSIPAGDSVQVQVTLVVPNSSTVDLSANEDFTGLITVQSTNQTKAVQITGGPEVIPDYDWPATTSGTDLGLFAVDFVNDNLGWAVGSKGTILKTTDSGDNWNSQTSDTTYRYYGVSFVDDNTGWVCGEGGTIIKTVNGGSSWSAQSSGIINDINSIYFLNSNNGFAVGGRYILKTTDGGANWSIYTLTSTYKPKEIYFINSTTGFAAGGISGGNSLILKTTNSGTSWVQKSASLTEEHFLYSIHFSDINNGWAAGTAGALTKTTDGGETWNSVDGITTNSLKAVYFNNTSEGWTVGEGGLILYTSDGGSNWEAQTSPATNYLYSLSFPSLNLGWCVGDLGTILKYSHADAYPDFIDNSIVSIHFDHANGMIDSLRFKDGSNQELLDQSWNITNKRGLGRLGNSDNNNCSVDEFTLYPDSATVIYTNPIYGSKTFKLRWSSSFGFEMDMYFDLTSQQLEGATWEPGGNNDGNDTLCVIKPDLSREKFPYAYPGGHTNLYDSVAYGALAWDGDYDEIYGYVYENIHDMSASNGVSADGPFQTIPVGTDVIHFAVKNNSNMEQWLNNYLPNDGPHFIDPGYSGENYTVVVQLVEIDGVGIEVGDELAVYDEGPGGLGINAALVFDGIYPIQITTHLETSVPGGSTLPGAIVGNDISFRIWDASTSTEYQGEPTFQTGGTFGEGFATNVTLVDAVLDITVPVVIPPNTIRMTSLPVEPDDYTVTAVLGGVSPFYMEGEHQTLGHQLYIPSWGLTSLTMDLVDGYKIFDPSEKTINYVGLPVGGGQTINIIGNSIMILGYPYSSSHTALQVFGGYPSIKYADDGQGNVYIPDWGLTNMTMYPGRGYKIYSEADITPFTFPVISNKTLIVKRKTEAEYEGRLEFNKTGDMYAVVIEEIDDKWGTITEGTEIGIYEGDKCVGGLLYTSEDQPLVAVAWMGDERLEIEGAKKGEAIRLEVIGIDEVYKIETEFSRGGTFGLEVFSAAKIKVIKNVPDSYQISQNYPNPFNPTTRIKYGLPEAGHVSLQIFNILGEKVADVVNQVQDAGYYEVEFDAGKLSSGIYIYSIYSNNFSDTKKMLLLK